MTNNRYKWNDFIGVLAYKSGMIDLYTNERTLTFSDKDKTVLDLLKVTETERGIITEDILEAEHRELLELLLENDFVYPIPDTINTDILHLLSQEFPFLSFDLLEYLILKIMSANVCIVGTGTLSSWLLPHLTSLQSTNLYLIDYDKVESHNVSRSPIFTAESKAEYKIKVFKNYLRSKRYKGEISCINKKIESLASVRECLEKIDDLDLVILTADEPSELLTDVFFQYTYQKNIPVIRASRLGVGPISLPHESKRCLSCEFLSDFEIDGEQVDGTSTRALNAKIRKDINTASSAIVAAHLYEFMIKVLVKRFAPDHYKDKIIVDQYGDRKELIEIYKNRCKKCKVCS